MSGLVASFLFGALVAVGAIVVARFMRDAAQQREREAWYASEWARRQRDGRQS
jgi:ABC-type cobalt transport system substrate-binding protein